jgi:DNA-binding CsgD family transcriptional regulator
MLLGRAEERRRIETVLETARSGQSAVLGFVGEPGIGKTALLTYAAERAEGFRILRARAVEAESHIPFSSLLELLRPVLSRLTDIPSQQAMSLESALALRPARPTERFAVGAAALGLLASAAEDEPVAVMIDDAHWLDPSSAEALRFTFRRLLADRVAAFVAAREGEPSFLDESGLPTTRVVGLARTDATALLAGHLGPELIESAVRSTGGNPLALLELAKGLDPLDLDAGHGGLVPVPTALARGFLRRASGLDADTSMLVVLAAVHDDVDCAALEKAAKFLGLGFERIADAEATGLLTLTDGRIEFCHPLARSAIYSSAAPETRRNAHRALAAVLSDRDADRRAWHLASAAIGSDARASTALQQAGERAQDRSAYAVAAGAFERAAGLAPDDGDRGDLLWSAASAAWQAGLADVSKALLARARAYVRDPARAVEIARLEGGIAVHLGPVMDGYAVLVAAAASADDDVGVELLAEAAIACFLAGRPMQMLDVADQARTRLKPGSGPRARFFVSMAHGMALVLGGEAAQGVREIGEAAALAESCGLSADPSLTAWVVLGPMFLRDDIAGRAVVDRALEVARSRLAVGALPFLLNLLARDQAGGGEWTSAGACYDESIGLSRETGQRTQYAAALSGLAVLEARQGRENACRSHANEARELCRELGMAYLETWTFGALGELELGLGRPSEAVGHFESQAQLLSSLGVTDPDNAPGPELAEAYLRLGRHGDAERVAKSFEMAAQEKGQPWALARARRCTGLVSGDDAFEACFEEALSLHGATPDVFEQARTSLAYGRRLRRARKRIGARGHLRSALETFDRLGARPWGELAQSELAATGETVRTRQSGTLFLLTPQEHRIALLLTDGMSTREAAAALFVSPKTVEYHLRHIYEKLGVRTREGLSSALGAVAGSGADGRGSR